MFTKKFIKKLCFQKKKLKKNKNKKNLQIHKKKFIKKFIYL